MASIGLDTETRWINGCGASIIGKNSLLTAGHCFDNYHFTRFNVVVGDSILNETQDDTYRKVYDIKRVEVHPKYQIGGDAAYYDVAVVFTKTNIEFNDGVKPICLPDKPVAFPDSREGELVTVAGWGLQKKRTRRKEHHLLEAHVSVFSLAYCNSTHAISGGPNGDIIANSLPHLFTSNLMCAGSEVGH